MASLTREEVLKSGEPDQEFMDFIKANPSPPVDYTSLESFRDLASRRNEMLMKLLGTTPPTIKKFELTYTTRDGTSLRALLFQPTTVPSTGSPLIVMYHGGGWCIGMPENEEQTCRNLVHAFGAVCLSVQYRLAPEFKFPVGTNDAWDALQWAAKSAESFGADPIKAGFVVGGTSAGGNLAAVLALKARDHGLSPPLTGQYLAIPATVPAERVPERFRDMYLSWEQNRNAPVLPRDAVEMFTRGYEPDIDDGENYAVLNHPKGHKGLAKAFLQLDGMDTLRDDGLIYEKALREEGGVETKFYLYPGLPHSHWSFFPGLSSSRKFREEQMVGFGWLLGREPDLSMIVKDAPPTIG